MDEETVFNRLRQVYRFPFQSPDWGQRYLIGTGLLFVSFLIPILPAIFVAGYFMRLMRNTIRGEELALPEWQEWGGLAVDGLRYLVICLVYLLPGIVVFFVGMGAYFFSFIGGAMSAQANDPSSGAFVLVSMLILFGSMAIAMLLFLLGAIPLPMALAHSAGKESLGAAFRIGEWWPLLRANKLEYFIAWVNIAGLTAILYTVVILAYYSLILICLVPPLSAFIGYYLGLVFAGLFGRIYRESL
ncbi:MAG TPA: DUF4013 domain-containing protein [Anaerolineales bacterium]|nr:DUF4013 domain-containing protein [Anaerolineales bacterium]